MVKASQRRTFQEFSLKSTGIIYIISTHIHNTYYIYIYIILIIIFYIYIYTAETISMMSMLFY